MRYDDILRCVEEEKVRFIRLQFTDILGSLKNVTITASQLRGALENGCGFDGSCIDGFARTEESDMQLRPDLSTFDILPWQDGAHRSARIICDVYNTDGTPFEGDPRRILRRAVEEAAKLGYVAQVGPECEFFLFQRDADGNPTTITQDQARYFDLATVDKGERARDDVILALEDMGFCIEASHHEDANGQQEIDFRFGEALKTADNVMTFKLAVKTVAQQHGLHATFMPKPLYHSAGSGMHTNLSLDREGKNIFYDAANTYGLSQEAYGFIAGLMRHVKAMTAICNPTVNSYKRLVPGYEAPCYIAWSARNRSPLIRIPACTPKATRVELRSPDPTANPYLVFAASIRAGLDGITKGLTPPAPIQANIFHMSRHELEEKGIESLPVSLEEAIECLRRDELMRETLGEYAFESYTRAKMQEWNEYRNHVSAWEIEQYLTKY